LPASSSHWLRPKGVYPRGSALDRCLHYMSLEDKIMLWTIFIVLLVLWALGLVTSYTMGGFIHIFLVIALVVLAINLIQGRRLV
jgi:hypothetical protein